MLELYIVLVLPTEEIPDETGVQIYFYPCVWFDLLCDFSSYMGLHL